MNKYTQKKIMIVEDDKDTIEVIDIFLKNSGYETILINNNFSDIIKIAKESRPNLILMDIQLVGVSGIKLIENLKSEPEFADIPIIAITALTNKSSKNKIMNHSECDAYIAKPFKREELIMMVKSFI
jgi:CheY-like chemotaxis protein